jgi:hypothetical protein
MLSTALLSPGGTVASSSIVNIDAEPAAGTADRLLFPVPPGVTKEDL